MQLVLLGLPLAFFVSFIASGLSGLLYHVVTYGWSEPEMFGWGGAFLLLGVIGLMVTAPSHIMFLIFGVVRRTQLSRHITGSAIAALVVGACAIFLVDAIGSKGLGFTTSSIASGIICMAIMIVIVAIFKHPKAEQGSAHQPTIR